VGLPLHDVNGMMRHILDCMGALKVRLSEELESKALIAVFGNAVRAIANHITETDLIDSQSATGLLLETFPDDMKRRDGRGWLPLHWAAAIHDTEPEDMKAVIQARPFNAVKGHLHCGNIGEQEAGDQSYRGLLPLHFAVSVQLICLLLMYPSATLVKDNTGRLPVHYVNDPEVRKLLMRASAPLARAGITDSFSRFVT
jgi:hypothetical protein